MSSEDQNLPAPSSPPAVSATRKKAGWAAMAVTLICGFEGCYTYAYRDPVGIPTVCFGHIEDVKMGDRYTKQQCKDMLLNDLPRYEAMVQKCIHVPLPDKAHAAILSFTYNVGGGALCKSSVARDINAGHGLKGCDDLTKYVYAAGIKLPGLVNRRRDERALCREGFAG